MIRNEIRGTPMLSENMPVRVVEKTDTHYLLETEFTDYHLNAAGAVHGGVLSAFLDCGLAGGGSIGEASSARAYGITMTMTVNFVRGAGPGLMRCEARVAGGGRSTKFVEARLYEPTGDKAGDEAQKQTPVATATGAVKVIELPEGSD